jgi:hypothetical protein
VISRDDAARRLGANVDENGPSFNGKSLLAAIGGWLGVLETTLPTFGFLLSFLLLNQATLSVVIAASTAVGFISWRLIRRQNATQAVVGFLAVGLAAWLALREGGDTADYFVPGFFTNAAYGLAFALSALVRWPIIGVLAGLLFGISDWRAQRQLRRRFTAITWLWVGFFAARLGVQLPLYFSNQIELLATSRLIMGAPAYAALLALTWVLLRATNEAYQSVSKLETEQRKDSDDQ